MSYCCFLSRSGLMQSTPVHSPFWPWASSHLLGGDSVHPCVHLSVYPHSHPSIQYRLGVCYGPGTVSSTSWKRSDGAFSWRPDVASHAVATLWQWSCWACALVTERGRLRALLHQSLLWVYVGLQDFFLPGLIHCFSASVCNCTGLPLSFCILFLSLFSLPVSFVLLGKVEKLSSLKHLWRRIASACSQFTRQALSTPCRPRTVQLCGASSSHWNVTSSRAGTECVHCFIFQEQHRSWPTVAVEGMNGWIVYISYLQWKAVFFLYVPPLPVLAKDLRTSPKQAMEAHTGKLCFSCMCLHCLFWPRT